MSAVSDPEPTKIFRCRMMLAAINVEIARVIEWAGARYFFHKFSLPFAGRSIFPVFPVFFLNFLCVTLDKSMPEF